MTIFQNLPVSSDKLLVWVFIPYRITEKGWESKDYDTPATRQELADVFAKLDIQWKWQPITFENMHEVVEEVATSSKEYVPVVLNYCAGDEDPNFPGTCVIKLLEAKSILFTGADSTLDYLCSSKLRMKRAFVEANVATAPYEIIADPSHVQGVCDRLGTTPLVKPALAYGSIAKSRSANKAA